MTILTKQRLEISIGFMVGILFCIGFWCCLDEFGLYITKVRGCEMNCEHFVHRKFTEFRGENQCYCGGEPAEDPELKAQEWKKDH